MAPIPAWQTEFVEVGAGAFAYVQAMGGFCVANAGLIVTEDGPIAVDALFTPAMTRAFLSAARSDGHGDVRLLINTHHHVDHTLGNALFTAPVLAHELVREEMLHSGFPKERICAMAPQFAEELEKVKGVRLPSLTFRGTMTIHDGDREIILRHVGTAHTKGDTLIYLPQSKLLYAGDIAFHYVTPLAHEGHIGNWIGVLDEIAGMDVETIVPGHGPVGTQADLREVRDYFALLKQEAQQAHAAGTGIDEAVRAIYPRLGRFGAWGEAERLYPNLVRLYQEFDGTIEQPIALGRAFDGMAAFREEITAARA